MYFSNRRNFLGLPFNIASFALLIDMIGQQCELEVGDFVLSAGYVHLYSNHLDQTNVQLGREPFALPSVKINRKPNSLFDYRFEDFEIINYNAHPSIKAPIAV